jgi:hypothetical protein
LDSDGDGNADCRDPDCDGVSGCEFGIDIYTFLDTAGDDVTTTSLMDCFQAISQSPDLALAVTEESDTRQVQM